MMMNLYSKSLTALLQVPTGSSQRGFEVGTALEIVRKLKGHDDTVHSRRKL